MTETRQRIVEAAAAAFMRQGYAGAGLKAITVESAAPFGSLYHFFPGGKAELAAETLRWSGAAYSQRVGRVVVAAPDVVTAMTAVFESAANTLETTDYADACPIATVALEVASSNDDLRKVTHEIFESWLDAAATNFVRAGIDSARARELAILFVAALEGGFLLSRAAKNPEPMLALGRAVADAVNEAMPESPHVSRK